jgi:tripartite-type tricarboxylate transporter receptor subunit TctC
LTARFSHGGIEPLLLIGFLNQRVISGGNQSLSLKGNRMKRLSLMLAALVAVSTTNFASAQDVYPSRGIKLVVPFAAGGNTDVVGRLTAAFLQNELGVSVVVENRAGAGGIVGTDAVVKSAPDGYTLCICGNGPLTVAPWTEKVTYDPLKDLMPISLINTNALVLIVNPKLDAKSAADLPALSKNTPNGLSYSTVGSGGLVTFSAEIFRVQTGASLVAVPYRGGALAATAVMSGEVQLSFANMSDAMAQISAGTVRALAVTTAERSPHTPDLPTLMELKLVSYPVMSWNALMAPVGTPQPIVDKLAALMVKMAKDDATQKRMAIVGSTSVANSPAEFTKMLHEESAQWGKALKEIGLRN